MGQKSLQLINIGQLVTSSANGLEIQSNTSIFVENAKIKGIGVGDSENRIDCGHKMVTAGFVDSHTHPIFFNKRDEEYAKRLNGESYEEIAKQGGGIISSVDGVRTASKETLIDKV